MTSAITRVGDGTYSGETDPAFWNLIGPFGGWIAAALLQGVLLEPGRLGEPISLSVNFAGAIEPGPFEIRAHNWRRNRSTDFWRTELVQHRDGRDFFCADASVVLAVRRATESFVDVAPPELPEPEGLQPLKAGSLGPAFLARYDMRFASTNFGGGAEPHRTMAWVRENGPLTLDFPGLVGLCDAGFPIIFARLKKRFPISTVTLNAFFHVTEHELAAVGDDFVLSDGRMRIAHEGFYDSSTAMWSRAGRLLATTEQIVYYKSS
jgi:acyl-CoA thioesterase